MNKGNDAVPREQWKQMGIDNAAQIEMAVHNLEATYQFGFFAEKVDFRALRRDMQQVQDLFNTLKPVADRSRLWDRFNNFRERAREAQKEEQSEYERRCRENSNEISNAIVRLTLTYQLDPANRMLGLTADLKNFNADAAEVGRLFRELKPLRKDDHDELWSSYQKLWDIVRDKRDQKTQEWRDNQTSFILKLEVLIDKDREYLSKLHWELSGNRDKLSDARNDSYRERVYGWIEETEAKISKVERQIEEKQEKISDIKERIYQSYK